MFFQLSLPSTPPTADTGEDTLPLELGMAGTLTVEPEDRPVPSVRVLVAAVRARKDALHCHVLEAGHAPVTFTAAPACFHLDDDLVPAQ